MKILKFIDHCLNFIVFGFFTLSLFFAGYALYDIYAVYGDTELTGEILKYRPVVDEYGILKNNFSIKDLQTINKDIIGWVKIDNTNIDYPILAGVDNTEYLRRNYMGKYSPSGSIFLDYRNSRDLTDDFSIIYGHNMARGLMFSDIKRFKDNSFFQLNKTGKLYTENGVYNLEIYSFSIIKANKDITYKLQQYGKGHNKELVSNLYNDAINKRNIIVGSDDKFLLLSTCYGLNSYDRSVLLTKMVKADGDIVINGDLEKDEEINNKLENDRNRIEKDNERTNTINKIIILIIYILIGSMIYIHIVVDHIRKKEE